MGQFFSSGDQNHLRPHQKNQKNSSRRWPETRLEECMPCKYSNFISNPTIVPLLSNSSWNPAGLGPQSSHEQESSVSPPCLAKQLAILFYFSKTLSPRFNLAPVNRSRAVSALVTVNTYMKNVIWQIISTSWQLLITSILYNPCETQIEFLELQISCSLSCITNMTRIRMPSL